MIVYLDTSVLVALAVAEAATERARAAIEGQCLVVSDFAMCEFASALSRRVRMKEMAAKDAQMLYDAFDAWTAQVVTRVAMDSTDTMHAIMLVRKFELGLRMPDALHIATSIRLSASILTLDAAMSAAARSLGLKVEA